MTYPLSKLDCTAVVLAAGKGTRMKSDLPKVAFELCGRPMIEHVLENLRLAGIRSFVLVVGYRKEDVASIVDRWKSNYPNITVRYAQQAEQKGTGHAVLCTEEALTDVTGAILVTNGDMPLIQPETFTMLLKEHGRARNRVTVLSAELENPFGYGRLVRTNTGELKGIVEEKDADEMTKKIREVNSGTYVFEAPDIFRVIRKIGSANAQNEYYLPDVISLYRAEKGAAGSLKAENAAECMGANSLEELRRLEELLQSGSVRHAVLN